MKFACVLTALLTIVRAAPSEGKDIKALQSEGCGKRTDARPFYRLHNGSKKNFYTLSAKEAESTAKLGYNHEGISGYMFPNPEHGTIPLYRLHHPSAEDHFYTTSAAERDSAVGLGYVTEGIAGYIYPDAKCGGEPFYRLHNVGSKDHFYTTSEDERDAAVKGGYTSEGVAGYVYRD